MKLDHAPGDDRGQEPGPRPRNCAAFPDPTDERLSAGDYRFLRAPAVNKPRSLSGIVEADETFHPRILPQRGRWSRTFRERRESARQERSQACWPLSRQHSHPCRQPATRNGATFDAILPQGRWRFGEPSPLAGVVTPGNHLIGDGGKAIATFARRAGIPFHAVPAPGKPTPEAPHLHINNVNAYHGRLKQWLNRFNGVATKNLPNYLGWRRALEAWGDKLEPPTWIKGAIGNGPYQQISL